MSKRCVLFATSLAVAFSFFFAQVESVALAEQLQEPEIREVRLGFGGVYKLGCWTSLEVDLLGGSTPYTGQLFVTVPDSDGVPTTIHSSEDRPVGIQPGQITTARLMIRVGQTYSPLEVNFFAEGKVRCKRKFYPGPEPAAGVIASGIPATNRLLVEFGPSLGLGELVASDQTDNELLMTRVAHLEDAASLPTSWIGYEAVDTVLMTTSKPALYRPLLQNPGRLESLHRWVELGGRLVVFCGSESAELLASDGPLADLIPGTYASLERLRQSHPLETFSGGEQLVAGNRRVDLQIPKLENVEGQILVHAGSRPTDLPIVVRSRLGLGELVFVGLDFDRPPLRDWAGRTTFLRKVLGWDAEGIEPDQLEQGLAAVESVDMIGQLRNALDSKFAGVEVVSFAFVAFLVLGYIVLIGPGDYYLVRKVFRRPELTWLTFPAMVIGVSAAAYFYANWTKGDQLRVNQVEVVDIDTTSGLARGTVWSHFFTPQVDKYHLTLVPSLFDNEGLENIDSQVSWLGLPGYALGGMQASATQTGVFKTGYAFSSARREMTALPVQIWSTKTISARWSAQIDSPIIRSELRPTVDRLLLGQFTNKTGIELDDCLLLYNHWAYYLGRVTEDATITIDHSRQPRTVKTLLTSATAGDTTITNTADDGTVPYHLASSDVTRLLKTMMFFKAINGHRYSGMLNRYQSFVDLSHLLQQDDCAILVAKSTISGSQWLNETKPLRGEEDRRWTFYRFLLPVTASPVTMSEE